MSHRDDLRGARELRRATERLPREMEPRRDLWPGIAGRLTEPRRREHGGGWWRLAAAMAVTAAGLLLALALQPARPAGEVRLIAAPSELATPIGAAHLRQRDGVLHAHNDLVVVIARRQGRVDAAGAAALAAGLAELERATAEIEEALVDNPNGRRLRLALAAAYRRESNWTSRLGHV